MAGLAELLAPMLAGGNLEQLSGKLGSNNGQTSDAIAAALPMLTAALARNAAKPGGAEAINNAIERDRHDQVLDQLSGFLSGNMNGGKATSGDAILKHLLGGRRSNVENAVGNASGLDSAQITKLLATLAPLVMGALAKQKQQTPTATGAGGLADLLGGERQRLQQSGMDGLLGSLLDDDGDGDVDGADIARKGMDLLGGFLKR